MSEEAASQHPHQPLGSRPSLVEGKDSPAYPPPTRGGYSRSFHLCVWHSPPVEGGAVCREKQGHILPHPRAWQPWPTLSCTSQGPTGPEPLCRGKTFVPSKPLSCMLAQTVPSPITGKELLDQTPTTTTPF